jgi:hypothetical protein
MDAHEMLDLRELDVEHWQPRPRATLVGEALLYDRVDGRYGPAHTVLIREASSGKIWRGWRTSTVLLQEFRRYKPRIGEAVGIRYHGRHPEKSYHRFKMWVDRRAAYDCPFTDEARALDEQADDGPPFRAGKTRQTPLGCTVSLAQG